jgi:hypothetical protein
MKVNRLLHMIIFCPLITCIFFSTVFAQGFKKTKVYWKGHNIEAVDGQIGIKIKDDTNSDSLVAKLQSLGYTFLDRPDKYGMARIRVPKDAEMAGALAIAKQTGLLEDVDPIVVTHIQVTPNDVNYSTYKWGLSSKQQYSFSK